MATIDKIFLQSWIVKFTYLCYNVVIPRISYTTLVATDREQLDFTGKSKLSDVVATGL